MPKIIPSEYESLKAFCKAFFEFLPKNYPALGFISPDNNPVIVLESFEKRSMSRARIGLGYAIGDIVEMSFSFPPTEVAKIDRDFADRGIVTLSEIRRRYSRQFLKILKRGIIRNDPEYYLITGVLATFSADASDEERVKLDSLIAAYESRL